MELTRALPQVAGEQWMRRKHRRGGRNMGRACGAVRMGAWWWVGGDGDVVPRAVKETTAACHAAALAASCVRPCTARYS